MALHNRPRTLAAGPKARALAMACRVLSTTLFFGGCGEQYGADDVFAGGHSHIPPIAKQSAQGAPVDGNASMALSVALPLRNEAELDALLLAQADPNSPHYGRFLQPDEFAERFLPTTQDVAVARASLLQAHLVPDEVAHGCLLGVHGRVADVEEAFQTALMHYVSYEGTSFVAPAREPKNPLGLSVTAVHGLVAGLGPKVLYHRLDTGEHKPAHERARAFAAVNASLTPAVTRSVYNVPNNATGLGQTVGLFQMDTYAPSDIAAFATRFGLPTPTITSIRLDGAPSTISDANVQVEVQLDIMMAMTMAPEANIRIYQGNSASGSAGYQYYLNVFNEMANPSQGDKLLVRSLSTSYGYFEAQLSSAALNSEGAIFKQMAAQGQTLFSAAGDTGAYGVNSQNACVTTVVDPAVQPYVCGVGGTHVTVGTDQGYGSETSWADGGGGISRLWALPGYQQSVGQSGAASSPNFRNAPDVALDADPNAGFQIVVQNQLVVVGGTSAAAPLWAGVHALINERRQQKNVAPLGFFNPVLYRVAGGPSATIFHDIVSGNNGKYAAHVGYDNVTGWGTPNVANVLDAFVGGYARIPLSGPNWLQLAAGDNEGAALSP